MMQTLTKFGALHDVSINFDTSCSGNQSLYDHLRADICTNCRAMADQCSPVASLESLLRTDCGQNYEVSQR